MKVNLGDRSYNIEVGNGLLEKSCKYISPIIHSQRVFIVTDENVASCGHLKTLEKSLDDGGIKYSSIIIPAGESSKSFVQLGSLTNSILEKKLERKSTLIALGGGVVGDITGFAASILLRGVNFIQIPTTLLAMVDSSVGGKTGINTRYGKNLVGSFYQPKLVLADVDTLKTLPNRELLAGYAEVLKYALINGEDFFTNNLEGLSGVSLDNVHKMITYCCNAKAQIVAEDEKEHGKRALLNLGHTFCHALEADMGYDGTLLHGEAVAIGMVMAFQFSSKIGICNASDTERVKKHLAAIGLPVSPKDISGKFTAEKLLENMYRDKKVSDGKLVFVLVKGIGKAFIKENVDKDDILSFLKEVL